MGKEHINPESFGMDLKFKAPGKDTYVHKQYGKAVVWGTTTLMLLSEWKLYVSIKNDILL